MEKEGGAEAGWIGVLFYPLSLSPSSLAPLSSLPHVPYVPPLSYRTVPYHPFINDIRPYRSRGKDSRPSPDQPPIRIPSRHVSHGREEKKWDGYLCASGEGDYVGKVALPS